MSIGLLLWFGFIAFVFMLGIIQYFRYPMVEVPEKPRNDVQNQSKMFQKIYHRLKHHGFQPYINLRYGLTKIDLAIIDIKVAVIFYSAEELLHPKKRKKLERKTKLLERNHWVVITVRERELRENFRSYLQLILVNANRFPLTD